MRPGQGGDTEEKAVSEETTNQDPIADESSARHLKFRARHLRRQLPEQSARSTHLKHFLLLLVPASSAVSMSRNDLKMFGDLLSTCRSGDATRLAKLSSDMPTERAQRRRQKIGQAVQTGRTSTLPESSTRFNIRKLQRFLGQRS